MSQAQSVSYFLLINMLLFMAVKGDYNLRVQVSGYSNPGNTCAECTNSAGDQVCCDSNQDTGSCSFVGRCDNEFFYCLMPLETTPSQTEIFNTVDTNSLTSRAGELGCLQPPAALRSDTNFNGQTIDFFTDVVLGLSNPLEFEVTARRWQGITLYVDVIDTNVGPDEDLVDVFLVNLEPADLAGGADMTTAQRFSGIFDIATIELSFQLECLPGFIGENCLDSSLICDSSFCNNGGICELTDDTNGFTCTCRGDFTGDTCDIMINDCLNVNCNNGNCMDRDRSFVCECEDGYSGQFCGQKVVISTDLDSTPSFSTDLDSTPNFSTDDTDDSDSSNNVGVVAGAVVGSILFILFIIIAVVIVLLLLAKWRINSPKAYEATQLRSTGGSTMENPVYEIAGLPMAITTKQEPLEGERDLDNPIYGLPDDSMTDIPADNGHYDMMYKF